MGALILKEKVSPRKVLGVMIIIAGVIISRL
jgi:drug/metabolite transporter (DMT)-like permease